jgi:SAM-dependent methyltransferase
MGIRPAARCPVCGALERHRLIWLYCRAKTDLFDGRPKRLLHVAPEPCLTRELRHIDALEYVGADLESRHAMVKMDVTAIQFDDASFDVILCNHVLEHVPDDQKAMRELLRVLKPGGWAIMQVPIKGETTQEDPAVTSATERTRLYGQHDHVRQYGRDYAERLRTAGFLVEVVPFATGLTQPARERYGVLADEELYCCTRPA